MDVEGRARAPDEGAAEVRRGQALWPRVWWRILRRARVDRRCGTVRCVGGGQGDRDHRAEEERAVLSGGRVHPTPCSAGRAGVVLRTLSGGDDEAT